MNSSTHQPSIEEVVYQALGPEMKGVAHAFVALAEAESVETVEDLVAAVRGNINDVSNLSFVTKESNRHYRLGIEGDSSFEETTVIVVRSAVDDGIRKLREYMTNSLSA